MMELLLYAIGQNFVFVLYTSMAQITVRCLSFCCDPTHTFNKGIAPTAIIVLVLLGRAMRQSERTVTTLPTLRSMNPVESRIGFSSRRDHVSEIDFQPTNSHQIRIDIKQDTEVMTNDTELDSMHRKTQSLPKSKDCSEDDAF
jgi:hypothetical protein